MHGAIQGTVEFLRANAAPLIYAVVIVLVLPLVAGYVVLVERKVMADMQARLGPMRVGPHGLLQPIADALKLLIKEDIIPEKADLWIFWVAPVASVTTSMVAFAGLAFGPAFQVARDINIGLLFVVGISALGIFGIVLGGWASNSHYSLLGALRSSAQLVSYETAAGMALVSGLMLSGTLQIRAIVEKQASEQVWFVFFAPVAFFTYLVASIAETNRAPFDLPEAESELVAGYMTEYSGFRWSLYFLAEYANMIVVASVATTLFLGGWLRPFPNVGWLRGLDYAPAALMLAVAAYCVYRAPKQPVRVQKLFMLAVAGLCAVGGARTGGAALRGRVDGFEAGDSRGVLVPVQGKRIHLCVHVAEVHAAALPVRPVDAAGVVFPHTGGHRERDRNRHRADPGVAVRFEPVAGAGDDDGGHAVDRGGADLSGPETRGGAAGAGEAGFGLLCWIR